MKMLTLPILLCALLALSSTADAQDVSGTKEPVPEQTVDEIPAPEAPLLGEAGNDTDASGKSVAKRATSCPGGWTLYRSRCFLYVSASYYWAQAENYCVSLGGNLASVHSSVEHEWLRNFIYGRTRNYPLTWIGGSDGEQERMWFWSDGSRFSYNSWCPGMPRTTTSYNCIAMNNSACRCWSDLPCSHRYPFVCVRK
ncbi:type-2 ice-structuring protein [Fundulus heteroclitus]|uniref:type-2 ice-structuring protein n=1 Tax=Fundulus heteroclitus TaxID=8078 RepID=UPI00165C71A5|nr:type-2 ice-structuring protein [Fundulus heteroclitus]